MTTHSHSIAVLLFTALAIAACPARTPAPRTAPVAAQHSRYQSQVDAVAGKLVGDGWIPGLSVGLIHGGRVEVYNHGRVEAGKGAAPTRSTLYEIGSITKAFTSILLAEMVRRGQVKLQDPISTLCPRGVKVPSRNGKQITLAHLATHSSGLPRMPDNFSPADPTRPYADYTTKLMYAFLSKHQLRRDPGARYEYSNFGAGLLGQLLARRAGKSYEALLRELVLGPLGMNDTAIQLPPRLQRRFARGHRGDTPVPPWDIPALAGAGGLRSSVDDMLAFMRANLGQQPSPLLEAMRVTHQRRGPASKGMSMGLGWHITAGGVVWHNGGTGGFHSFAAFDPRQKTAVVVLGNSNSPIVDVLGRRLMGMLGGKKLALELPRQVQLAPAVLDRYVGSYELAPGVYFTVTRKGAGLLVKLTGQPAIPVYAESETRFNYRVVKAAISFAEIADGKAGALVLHQGGKDQTARRVASIPKRKLPAVVKLGAAVLDVHVGRYQLAPGVLVSISRRGEQLLAQVTGQPALPIFPESKTRFFYKVVPAVIVFHQDAAGKTVKLVLHQSGREMPASRVE